MSQPVSTPLISPATRGDLIKRESDPDYTRETVTLKAGAAYPLGAVLGRITLDGNRICCHVENSLFPKQKSDKSGSGIGLANLQRQLELLYPESHDYSAAAIGDRYVAELSITLNATKD